MKLLKLFIIGIMLLCFFPLKTAKNESINVVLVDSGISNSMKNKIPKNWQIKSYSEKKNNNNHADLVLQNIIETTNKDINVIIHDIIVSDEGSVTNDNLVNTLKNIQNIDCDIINLSLGVNSSKPELKKIVTELSNKNKIIVAASGNNYGMTSQYPARFDNTISVGSTDENYTISKFSSRKNVDFYTIGEYDNYSGTSFSTPIITGHTINILAKKNINTLLDVKKQLESKCEPGTNIIK